MNLRRKNILSLLILILFRTMAYAADINPFDGVRYLPGFSAQISMDDCKKEFPFNETISRKLFNGTSGTFSVFAFTTKEFDPSRESVLVIHGGPGGIWNNLGAKKISDLFSEKNIIFFHYRGGGCSSFPSSDQAFDSKINSIATLGDIEGIRTAYGIKKWKAIVGFSYGTNVARMYAHFNPTRTESLVLEGLDFPGRRDKPKSLDHEVAANQSENILKIIKDRCQNSKNLLNYLSADNCNQFIENVLPQYLSQIPVNMNYFFMGFWSTYKDQYESYYKQVAQPLPRYLNAQTFTSVTALAYANSDETSDGIILALLSQFIDINLSEKVRTDLRSYLNNIAYGFYPFLNPDYLSYFHNGQLVSFRVQLAMSNNDGKTSIESLCSGVKTIVLNGTVDSVTPIENVKSYLSNKTCATHEKNIALVVHGGGHSNLTSMKCLSDYVNNFINGAEGNIQPEDCSLPVTVERF